MIPLPQDFSEFLQSLNEQQVRYLLIGGYAVAYHGYPRSTADMDIWIDMEATNAQAVLAAIQAFGFPTQAIDPQTLLQPNNILRLGVAPLRIEVFSSIPGVDFDTCYARRVETTIDGVLIPVINLADLKQNKIASGRPKDMDDLQNLP
ncbi:MAG TPA: DUF6036 family nucleotidyltransferase [Roseiflexaceae bacterium]|nr:DUF6036 family nucleotidyltransferase [Roseiflexaceae bacterium]